MLHRGWKPQAHSYEGQSPGIYGGGDGVAHVHEAKVFPDRFGGL